MPSPISSGCWSAWAFFLRDFFLIRAGSRGRRVRFLRRRAMAAASPHGVGFLHRLVGGAEHPEVGRRFGGQEFASPPVPRAERAMQDQQLPEAVRLRALDEIRVDSRKIAERVAADEFDDAVVVLLRAGV